MYPNALQWTSIALHAMDNATLLSFMHNVDEKGQAENAAPMRTKLGEYWTPFHEAYDLYDQVFNPARRSLDTEDLKNLDEARDNALGAFHEALLGLQRNPNDAKKQAARLLLLNYDTYKPDRGQEYMKETELIDQMLKDIADRSDLHDAVTLLGLDDYVADLSAKNEAFAAIMRGRTASTEGYQKGAVAEARTDMEAKYQLLRQMQNVVSIYEGDTDYRPFLLAVNAEAEHYKLILARKGVSGNSSEGGNSNGGSDSGNGGNNNNGGGGTTPQPDPDAGFGGGDNNGGGGTTPQPDPDAGFGGGDDNNGGGTTPQPDPDAGFGGS